MNVVKRFEQNNAFTEEEAWGLFRFAAIGEACGWSLLITGIILQRLFKEHDPVLVAGQIHGMLFLCYALAALGLYPSLRWSRIRACFALIASIPPYGSLLFEQWAAYQREKTRLGIYRDNLVVQTLVKAVTDE